MTLSRSPVPITPVETGPLPDIPDPTLHSVEAAAASIRHDAVSKLTAMPWLPQLPDQWMDDIYERLCEAERRIAAPHLLAEDYREGTATEDDEIEIVTGEGDLLLSAIHATFTKRRDPQNPEKRIPGFPDTGTAGLASVLAEDYGTAYIMKGKQTGNAAVDEVHPIKQLIGERVLTSSGLLDVHGCASHLFTDPRDTFNMHASIGLGLYPSEAEREIATAIQHYGRSELGLHVVIGNDQQYYSQQNPAQVPKRYEDGTAYRHQLAAFRPSMLTNVMREKAAELETTLLTLQLELAGILRVTALNDRNYPKNRRTRRVGAALGYELMRFAADRLQLTGRAHDVRDRV